MAGTNGTSSSYSLPIRSRLAGRDVRASADSSMEPSWNSIAGAAGVGSSLVSVNRSFTSQQNHTEPIKITPEMWGLMQRHPGRGGLTVPAGGFRFGGLGGRSSSNSLSKAASPTKQPRTSSPASSSRRASFSPGRSSRKQHGEQRKQHGEQDQQGNFKVVIRVRPPLPRELHGNEPFQKIFSVADDCRQISIGEQIDDNGNIANAYGSHRFTFDQVYDEFSTQRQVYLNTARPAVLSTLKGYNATILAYGQTGTGKTYTMEGFNSHDSRGIIPRSVEEIFSYIVNNANPSARFLVRASYLQIYNEVISDLLKPSRKHLQIREDKKKGVFVEGLSEWVVRSPKEVYSLIQKGSAIRATGPTRMNSTSSRSHALFIIIIEQNEIIVDKTRSDAKPRRTFRVGKLNLVDLAGSERVRLSGAVGQRLEESKKINKSLSALGNVISALTERKHRSHVPYRDSKLTRILEDSLGGNCKTTMMAMISPALMSFNESLSTLKFANRAKNIKNSAYINEDLDEKTLLRRYEKELKRLRHELQTRNKNVVDKRKLIEVEEQRRQAEQDKLAAIMNMERLSASLMSEKEAKKRLEEKIRQMNEQLLVGGWSGGPVRETPAFKVALQQEQARIRKMYQTKVAELEREREAMEEEKVQTDRYRQLLLKQRDVMIQLTARLNERDQSIMVLQEELEAYDQHQRMMEDALDQKTATLIHLQKRNMQHNNANNTQKKGGMIPATNSNSGININQANEIDSSRKENMINNSLVENGRRDSEEKSEGDEDDHHPDHVQQTKARFKTSSIGEQNNDALVTYKHMCQSLRSKLNVQLQERSAVCVILEKKMKTLVDRVATMTLENDNLNPQTRQEIEVLQRLIHASIIALKQSDPRGNGSSDDTLVGKHERTNLLPQQHPKRNPQPLDVLPPPAMM